MNNTFDIQYNKLKQTVRELSPTEVTIIPYRGRDYFVDPEAEQGPAGEFHPSTVYDGADVYVWKQVPQKLRLPVIFHEVVEADLRIHQGAPKQEAHDLAALLDAQFAKDTFDTETMHSYSDFSEHQRGKF